MYDWAISSMQTVIMTAVFPIFFISVAGNGKPPEIATQALANVNTIAAVTIALLGPVLGAVADFKAAKKRFLGGFMMIGVFSIIGMYFIRHGDLILASVLFILSMASASGSTTFYESLLPHLADEHEIDRVSTAGYALGYIGGGVLLALNLAWITNPGLIGLESGDNLTREQATLPVRIAFVSVALWWLLFSIPLFRRVAEPRRTLEEDEWAGANPFRVAFTRLGETLRELRNYRQAFLAMLAFTIYNDGIQTIIKMATAYGTEIGIERSDLITAILIVQFVGIPCSFAFGSLAGKLGAKLSILGGLLVYTGICVFAYDISTAREFFILAILVGTVQGGTQALSRSLFASMVPKHKSGEFFGFYSVFEKFGGVLGPLVFSLAIGQTGSSRGAILWVIGFFVVGGSVLMLVNTREGEEMASEVNRRLHNP